MLAEAPRLVPNLTTHFDTRHRQWPLRIGVVNEAQPFGRHPFEGPSDDPTPIVAMTFALKDLLVAPSRPIGPFGARLA